jgi:hypothetical protein
VSEIKLSTKPPKLTKKWIDEISTFLDEKKMRDPNTKGNRLALSPEMFAKVGKGLFRHAAKRGINIILHPMFKGNIGYVTKASYLHSGR